MKPELRNGLVKMLNHHREKIAAERDALRELRDEIEAVLEPTERGLDLLDDAIAALSEQS